MTVPALATGWYVGWAIGLVVVLLAAGLLVTIIGIGRRITAQAVAIKEALDGAHANTDALWEVRATNHTVDRVTRQLAVAREMLTR